jgi:deaminated glutathione amidase
MRKIPVPISQSTNKVKVAAVQMVSGTDFSANLAAAEHWIKAAADQGAQIVVLPEYFAIMGRKETDKLSLVEKHGEGPLQQFLGRMAKEFKLWLVGGTHGVASADPSRPYSRCYVFDPNGACVSWYDKIHLFDVKVEDATGNYRESQTAMPGDLPGYVKTPWGTAGLSVCYDLRFPELFRHMVKQDMRLLFLPAAFTAATGKVHWEVLLKARAIENQIFVVAAAQGGKHENGRETFGHSTIISPWGEILACLPEGPGIVCAELDFAQQQKIRNEFPVLDHTRL